MTLFVFLFQFSGALAQPYIPASDDLVLEKITNSQVDKKLKRLRDVLKQKPQNVDLAYLLAKAYIDLGSREADPRYYSYAESILKPWWDKKDAQENILLLRANIKQFRHEFDDSLEDLALVLKKNSRNDQARLMRASIYTLQAKYENALQDCQSLSSVDSLTKATCITLVESMGSRANKSYLKLRILFDNEFQLKKPTASSETLWTLVSLAEIAARLAKKDQANKYYMKIFELLSPLKLSPYLITSFSDFLLDQEEYSSVISLLRDSPHDYTKNDNLLLRLALAEKQKNDRTGVESKEYKNYLEDLKQRFKASRERGDNPHLREEAIFYMKLMKQYKLALELAKENWKTQKEPIDIRLLYEAAILAGDKSELKKMRSFITKNNYRDLMIIKLDQKEKANQK